MSDLNPDRDKIAQAASCTYILTDVYIGTYLVASNQKTLLDSGATTSSHIDIDLVMSNIDNVRNCLSETTSTLRVANGQTSSASFMVNNVTLVHRKNSGNTYIFSNMRMLASKLSTSVIVGLPHLVTLLLPIFVGRLLNARHILTPCVVPRVFKKKVKPIISDRVTEITEVHEVVEELEQEVKSTKNPNLISFLNNEKLEEIVKAHQDKRNISPVNDDEEVIPELDKLKDSEIYDSFLLNRDFKNNVKVYLSKVNTIFNDNVDIDPKMKEKFISLLSSKLAQGVHVPHESNWTGIVDENGHPYIIEFEFDTNMPDSHYTRPIPVNSKIHDAVRAEIHKLASTIWVECHNASIVHPVVIAPKKTDPFFRIAISFKFSNKYTLSIHAYIPDFRKALERLAAYKYYIDTDMKASFRQLRLGEKTSRTLAIITPWGIFRSKFMMEGSKCSSAVLQNTMNKIFGSYAFIIQIFDNFVICGKTPDDLFNNYVTFLQTCAKHNIFINFDKTFVFLKKITFFGYEASSTGYTIEPKKVKQLTALPFPVTKAMLQHSLGITVYFIPFVPGYKLIAAPVTSMLQKGFSWDQDKWSHDYRNSWNILLKACAEAWSLYFPNYDLEWHLNVDWCPIGVSYFLVQFAKHIDQTTSLEVIRPELLSLGSQRLSAPAQKKFSAIMGEAFAMHHGVQENRHHLDYQPYTLNSDHRNLTFLARVQDPQIDRILMNIQSTQLKALVFVKQNPHADGLSRYPHDDNVSDTPVADCNHLVSPEITSFTPVEEEGKKVPVDSFLQYIADNIDTDYLMALQNAAGTIPLQQHYSTPDLLYHLSVSQGHFEGVHKVDVIEELNSVAYDSQHYLYELDEEVPITRSPLKLLTLNVNGLGNAFKKNSFKQLLFVETEQGFKYPKYDLVALQETKIKVSTEQSYKHLFEQFGYVAV